MRFRLGRKTRAHGTGLSSPVPLLVEAPHHGVIPTGKGEYLSLSLPLTRVNDGLSCGTGGGSALGAGLRENPERLSKGVLTDFSLQADLSI